MPWINKTYIKHKIKILTLKEKDINTILIIWEFSRLHLTPTIMSLVPYRHVNHKHTRWSVKEDDDYTKNPKAIVQDWLFFSTLALCINPNSDTH